VAKGDGGMQLHVVEGVGNEVRQFRLRVRGGYKEARFIGIIPGVQTEDGEQCRQGRYQQTHSLTNPSTMVTLW
jgi:hypothetical protein